MRQLLGEAYMHNRVRMIVGSFLTKDLHLHWRRGTRHFMQHLRDGDLASNAHGWQWIAGTGTDPSPYFRVFNPVKQGRDHDPTATTSALGAGAARPAGEGGPRAVAAAGRTAGGLPAPGRRPRRGAPEALRRYAAVKDAS
jgi:deoxyribodipyrimidine photo-lyase